MTNPTIFALTQIHRIADQLVGDSRCSEQPGCLLKKGHSIGGIRDLAKQALADLGVAVESHYFRTTAEDYQMKKQIAVLCLVLSACGGGGGGSGGASSSGGAQPLDVSGIYTGTVSSGGTVTDLSGMIDSQGNARFLEHFTTPAGVITSQSPPIRTTTSHFGYGALLVVATNSQPIELVADVNPQSRLTGTFSDSSVSGSFNLTWQPAYNTPSSLATVAGSYTCSGTCSGAATIDAHGNLTASDSSSFPITGTISTNDPAHNVYQVSMSVNRGGLGTFTFTGLASYAPATSSEPGKLAILATGHEAFNAVLSRQ